MLLRSIICFYHKPSSDIKIFIIVFTVDLKDHSLTLDTAAQNVGVVDAIYQAALDEGKFVGFGVCRTLLLLLNAQLFRF